QPPEVRIDACRAVPLPGQPLIDVGIALLQQQGIALEPAAVHRRKMTVGEAAENQIHFPCTPMPGAESQALAESLVVDGHGGRMGSTFAERTSRLRPEVLYPLFAQTTTLPGIGPRLGKLIENIAGRNLVSLCWHMPTGVIDRRFSPKLAEAPEGVIVTVTVTVDSHLPPANRRLPYKVRCHDETAGLMLVFFHGHEEYLVRQLPIGQERVVSGKVEHYGGLLQMTHPDYIA